MLNLKKIYQSIILVLLIHRNFVHGNAFDLDLYEEVLDPQECDRQLDYILCNNSWLKGEFLDASARTPRGILISNLRDMGNYHQCLGIKEETENMSIEGKYCVVEVPLLLNSEAPSFSIIGSIFPFSELYENGKINPRVIDEKTYEKLLHFDNTKKNIKKVIGNYRNDQPRIADGITPGELEFELAICIPKVCTTDQTIRILTQNESSTDIRESFCRLPNDKPWVAADYVAIAIFSLIGLITLGSTFYEVLHTFVLNKDPQKANKILSICSVYGNTKKFFKFSTNSNSLSCLEGVRSIAMLWVIVCHTYSLKTTFVPANPIDVFDFLKSFWSIWITSSAITVDTFFMMTGLLLVYTTTPKFSRVGFVKNLHYFYLNRYFRMFAPLATTVLLQASFLNHFSDGPYWETVAKSTEDCRQYWWTTLLYVHNFASFGYLCVGHSWYLAVDMQLYVLSPIVLIWVIGGSKRTAWIALLGSFLAVVSASTIFNFIMEFPSTSLTLSRREDLGYYIQYYYINTLPRAAPFFVGMIFGYLLHVTKGKRVHIKKPVVVLLWILSLTATTGVMIAHYFIMQPDWDNQTVDSVLNSFMRPVWAAGVAWIVFACVHGYGGPVNWFLSLHIFRVIGRLSYIMYIIHLPILYLVHSTALSPVYFSDEFAFYQLMVNINITLVASFLIAILIDIPFATVVGIVLGQKKTVRKSNAVGPSNVENSIKSKLPERIH